MSAKSAETARNLSLEPPLEVKPTGSVFLDAWYDKERNLRLALAQLRALKMKKETKNLPLPNDGDVVQAARTAVGMENPLGAEQFLNQYRLGVLDRMTPLDMFSADSVYNHGQYIYFLTFLSILVISCLIPPDFVFEVIFLCYEGQKVFYPSFMINQITKLSGSCF